MHRIGADALEDWRDWHRAGIPCPLGNSFPELSQKVLNLYPLKCPNPNSDSSPQVEIRKSEGPYAFFLRLKVQSDTLIAIAKDPE